MAPRLTAGAYQPWPTGPSLQGGEEARRRFHSFARLAPAREKAGAEGEGRPGRGRPQRLQQAGQGAGGARGPPGRCREPGLLSPP